MTVRIRQEDDGDKNVNGGLRPSTARTGSYAVRYRLVAPLVLRGYSDIHTFQSNVVTSRSPSSIIGTVCISAKASPDEGALYDGHCQLKGSAKPCC